MAENRKKDSLKTTFKMNSEQPSKDKPLNEESKPPQPKRGEDEDFGRSSRQRFPDEKDLPMGEEQRDSRSENAFISPSGKAELRRDKGRLKERGEKDRIKT